MLPWTVSISLENAKQETTEVIAVAASVALRISLAVSAHVSAPSLNSGFVRPYLDSQLRAC